MDTSFEIASFFEERRAAILDRAEAAVASGHLPHYEAAGPGEVANRLRSLFDAVLASADVRNLEPALTHADGMADARQRTGYHLSEVQRAVNALEEQLWAAVLEEVPAESQGFVLGVVSTVLGAIKDRLACDYLAGATSTRPATLRLDELFKGASAGPV